MAVPTVVVEVDFGGTMTDISAFVMAAEWSTGATNPRDAWLVADAGAARVTLDNRDGRFDPDNTASPYSPYVRPNRRVRISVVWRGLTHTVWTGTADAWDVVEEGRISTVVLSASDAVKVLARAKLADTAPSGAGETGSARVGRILDAVSWPAADRDVSPGGLPMQAVTLSGEAWRLLADVTRDQLGELVVDAEGRVRWRSWRDRSLRTSAWARAVDDLRTSVGAWWRLGEAMGTVAASDSGPNGYHATHVNNVQVGQVGAVVGDPDKAAGYLSALSTRTTTPVAARTLLTGQSATNAIAYDWSLECWTNPVSVLSTQDLLTWIDTGKSGLYVASNAWRFRVFGGAASAEITASATAGRWTHVVGTFEAATKTLRLYVDGALVSTATFGGTSIADQTAPALGGNPTAYLTGQLDEVIVWRKRLSDAEVARLHGAAVASSWADDGTGLLPERVLLSRNDDSLVTEVYATRSGGVTQYVQETTAMADYGRYTLVEDLLLPDDLTAGDWGGGVLASLAVTRRRPVELLTAPMLEDGQFDALIALRPGDVVQVTRTMPDGRVVSDRATVAGWTVAVSDVRWTWRLRLAHLHRPGFRLDVSVLDGDDRLVR